MSALNPQAVLHELHEYVAFIVLLASLFIVSGSIVLRGDIEASPKNNVIFLACGSVLANVIGTTGASMVLIRPFLRTNQERKQTGHLPIFFIFLVSNIGGMLTPIGDPPLFLGFLRGVPFFWTLRLFPIWLFSITIVLTVFYFWDTRAYHRESLDDIERDFIEQAPLQLAGKINLVFLVGIVLGVFLPSPFRELDMGLMAVLSLRFAPPALRAENRFSYHPILEVAILFAGIFFAMIPALELLHLHGRELGMTQPWQFFWGTGLLSTFLDNAPTYLSFLSLAQSLDLPKEVVHISHQMLMAISVGAVMMGANSYIGNGPNFMVKAIADEAGLKTPHFFQYIGIALLILGPIYGIIAFFFSLS